MVVPSVDRLKGENLLRLFALSSKSKVLGLEASYRLSLFVSDNDIPELDQPLSRNGFDGRGTTRGGEHRISCER